MTEVVQHGEEAKLFISALASAGVWGQDVWNRVVGVDESAVTN